jgi:hypothetical protein
MKWLRDRRSSSSGKQNRRSFSVRCAGIFDVLWRCATLRSCWKNVGWKPIIRWSGNGAALRRLGWARASQLLPCVHENAECNRKALQTLPEAGTRQRPRPGGTSGIRVVLESQKKTEKISRPERLRLSKPNNPEARSRIRIKPAGGSGLPLCDRHGAVGELRSPTKDRGMKHRSHPSPPRIYKKKPRKLVARLH